MTKNTVMRRLMSYLCLLMLIVVMVFGPTPTTIVFADSISGMAPQTTLALPVPSAVRPYYSRTTAFSWYFIDLHNGVAGGSANAASWRNYSESMIKPGIVGDYLRRLGKVPTSTELAELKNMIIYSNDYYAEKYWKKGGGDAVTRRIISTCGLSHTAVTSGWWSKTLIPAVDAAKYGKCIGDGRLAGSRAGFPGNLTATQWLLQVMRQVAGSVSQVDLRYSPAQKDGGRWGIIDAINASAPSLSTQVSIKNGWTYHSNTGKWHVNCLAVHKDWVLAIEMKTSSKAAGAYECKQAAAKFIVTPRVLIPSSPS